MLKMGDMVNELIRMCEACQKIQVYTSVKVGISEIENHFKHYLYGKRFLLRTDHKAITFMMNTNKPITPQFQNWINYLSSLDIKMALRQGSKHSNADMLSRVN